MRPTASRLLLFVRWWFGLTYFLGGIGGMISAPIMLANGNSAGIYALIGGAELAALGWLVHPWGRQRRKTRA